MWPKRKPEDFGDEIEAHIQLEADQLRAEGVPPQEANAAARRAFGSRTSALERFYESGHWMWWDHFVRDVRLAVRILKRDARFTLLAVIGLALGLGANTAIFIVITTDLRLSDNAAVQDAASYVGLNRSVKGRLDTTFSYADFRYYQAHATTFRIMNAQSGRFPFILGPHPGGTATPEAQDVEGRFVSETFLSVDGLPPALGRTFSVEEGREGGPPVVALNFRFWTRHLGADTGVLNKTLVLNGHVLTIVGIANAQYARLDTDLYLPLVLQPVLLGRGDWLRDSQQRWLSVDALLSPGVTVRRAQADVDVLASALHSGEQTAEGVVVSSGGPNPDKRRAGYAMALGVLVAVSMILLVACSNLANLLLARAVVRRGEIAVRLALGASRARLIWQLLTENMLLAIMGGALGLIFSAWLAQYLIALTVPPNSGVQVRFDSVIVLYGLGLALATGISFGLGPAVASTRAASLPSQELRQATSNRFRGAWSPRNALVIVPLAVSLMLLIGAALTLRAIQRTNFGGPAFDTSRLVTMSFPLSVQGYDEPRTRQFQEDLLDRVSGMPGITSAALAANIPFANGLGSFPLITAGATTPQSSDLSVDYNVVSPRFFETLGVAVIRGRGFNDVDGKSSMPVAMVNETLARRLWPGEEPLQKSIRFATGTDFFEVIGVAPDLEDARAPLNAVRPTVYVPYGQEKRLLSGVQTNPPAYQMRLLVRTNGEPTAAETSLRQQALVGDQSLRVNLQTLDEMLANARGPFTTISVLLSVLGALALLMATVGIYATVAYGLSQRTREIGIRMALGAERRDILKLVMMRTAMLIASGIAAGLLGALALQRIMASTVAWLGGLDTVTWVSPAVLLAVVAMLATYFPARRALQVDPMMAIRCE
jgi:predicted permease